MRLNIVSQVMIVGGSVLVYAAVKDKHPADLIRTVLTGGKPSDARSITGVRGQASPAPGVGADPNKYKQPSIPGQPTKQIPG